MARITVEDCLSREGNRFALVQLASQRTKQLLLGAQPTIADTRGNKSVVTALREIADGAVRFMTEEDMARVKEREMRELEAANADPVAAAGTVIQSNGDSGGGESGSAEEADSGEESAESTEGSQDGDE